MTAPQSSSAVPSNTFWRYNGLPYIVSPHK
jgi:hypothetical protein